MTNSRELIELSLSQELRLTQTLKTIESATETDLREIAVQLAHLALGTQPAAIKWLANEAAANLGFVWSGHSLQEKPFMQRTEINVRPEKNR